MPGRAPIALAAAALTFLGIARYRRDLRCDYERLATFEPSVIDTPFGRVEYALAGEGPPVLVVHGVFGGFDFGVGVGRVHVPAGYRIISPSRFGFFGSPLPPDPSPAAQADAFAALLDHLKIDALPVVAFSAGSSSAVQLALRHPCGSDDAAYAALAASSLVSDLTVLRKHRQGWGMAPSLVALFGSSAQRDCGLRAMTQAGCGITLRGMEASPLHTAKHLPERLIPRPAAHSESWSVQLRWFAIAALVGFVVPLLGSSVLELQHDVYLGIYFAAVLALTWAYTRATGADWRTILVRNWKASLLLGVVFGFVLVRNVLTEDATPHPDGAYFWFELVWRGGFYGAIDALLLTVLPCTMVHRALGGRLSTWGKRLAYFGASAALIVTITAVYHLGYAQYRQDGLRQPETGNTIISVPMLLTANPIGSVGSHAAMHVSAAAHIYETDVRLPPAVEAD